MRRLAPKLLIDRMAAGSKRARSRQQTASPRSSRLQQRKKKDFFGVQERVSGIIKKSDISSSRLNYPSIGFWIFWSHDPSHQVHHISPSKLIYSSTGFLSHSIHRVIEFPFLNFSHIYSSQRRLVMYWANWFVPASGSFIKPIVILRILLSSPLLRPSLVLAIKNSN